jgi:potA: polyamine ABC transporter, ATP-binding protein
VDVERQHCFVF